MALLVKAGIIGGLSTSVIVPVALTSSTGTKSVGLLDLDSPKEIEKQTPPKNTLETLSRAGYRKKKGNELVDFNKDRDTYDGGNFALGCHRLLFGGKNVPRLPDYYDNDISIWDWNPMSGYLGSEESDPVLGCSTASVMAWGSEDAYEYELAVKRGDKGFLERVTVRKGKPSVSQLVFYKKIQNPKNKEYSWFHWYGLQRKLTNYESFEIGNPKDGTWTVLNLEKGPQDNPNYFTVWIEGSEEKRVQAMIDNLGIRFKSNQKLFSSIAKADRDDWKFSVFGTKGWGIYTSIDVYPDNEKKPATYTSKIANDVESFRGVWQDVTKFCESQEGRENANLPHEEAERLRNYCYTNKG